MQMSVNKNLFRTFSGVVVVLFLWCERKNSSMDRKKEKDATSRMVDGVDVESIRRESEEMFKEFEEKNKDNFPKGKETFSTKPVFNKK